MGATMMGGLVTHAARGVLIYALVAEDGQINRVTRRGHGLGEVKDLTVGHAFEIDRHAKGGHLVVGDVSVGVPARRS